MPEEKDVKTDTSSSDVDPTQIHEDNKSQDDKSQDDKKTIDPIPYERFKEVNDERTALETERNELLDKIKQYETKHFNDNNDTDNDEFDWNMLALDEPEQKAPLQPDPTDFNMKFRESFDNDPMTTTVNLINAIIAENEKKKTTVRKIPGYHDLETEMYNVPSDMIRQAQQNPDLIRLLLASFRTKKNTNATTPNANIDVQMSSPDISNTSNTPLQANDLNKLIELAKKTGVDEALARLDAQSGITGEGSQGIPSEPDEPEFHREDQVILRKLGLSDDNIKNAAKRYVMENQIVDYLGGK